MTARVAIVISGGGSNMVALAKAMAADVLARSVIVISNRPEATGLAKAAALGIPTAVVDHREFGDRDTFEKALADEIHNAKADVICLAGFMRILSAAFVSQFEGRMLNIHPSLLPKFKGLHTHARALETGEQEHGCSVHLVTADLDDGPILGQARCPVLPADTPQTLAARVLPLEHQLYPAVLHRFVSGDTRPVMIGP